MASILYLPVLILVYTAIGRLSVPCRERTALRTWTPRDVWRNAALAGVQEPAICKAEG